MMRLYANGMVADLMCDRCGAHVDELWRTSERYPGWKGEEHDREMWVCRPCMDGRRTSRALSAREMFRHGASVREVAGHFGVSETTARKWRERYR